MLGRPNRVFLNHRDEEPRGACVQSVFLYSGCLVFCFGTRMRDLGLFSLPVFKEIITARVGSGALRSNRRE